MVLGANTHPSRRERRELPGGWRVVRRIRDFCLPPISFRITMIAIAQARPLCAVHRQKLQLLLTRFGSTSFQREDRAG